MASAGRMMGAREQAIGLLNEAKVQADATSKADLLKNVMEILLHREPSLLAEFVPYLMELQSEPGSPVRKYLAEIIEEIGTRHVEHISTMVPVLLALLQDTTPAVARRAITSGSNIFRTVLEQVASQGIYASQVEKQLVDAWNLMIRFKDAVYPAAFQHGNDGVRLLAVKFVETTILLFTHDPNGSSRPLPNQHNSDGVVKGFNIAWIAGGHPLLDANAMGQEASKNLGLLLNQLRAPESSTLPGPVAIVLVNSLAGIAKRRPSMFGRILPVLLALAPDCEPIKGGQVASVIHTLKTAFLSLLKCSQPGALPWRDRLTKALHSMNAGDVADQALRQLDRAQRADRDRASKDPWTFKDEAVQQLSTAAVVEERPFQKRPVADENGNQSVEAEESLGKRMRLNPNTNSIQPELASVSSSVAEPSSGNDGVVSDNSLAPLLAYFGALIAQGERGAASVEILISSLTPDMLAELVIVNMQHLPSTPPPLPPGVGPSVSGSLVTLLSSVPSQSVLLPPGSAAAVETGVLSFQPIPQHVEVSRDPRRDPRRMDPRRAAAKELAPTALSTPKLEAEEVDQLSNMTVGTMTQATVKVEGAACSSTLSSRDPRAALSQNVTNHPPALPPVQVKQEPVEESGPLASTPPLSPPDSLMAPSSGPAIPVKSEPTSSFSVSAPALPHDPQRGASLIASVGAGSAGVPVSVPIQPIPLVPLTEEQQTSLSKAALVRILEGHKTIAAAGGGDLRVALLARLVAQLPDVGWQSCDDAEALELLQKHILADYQSHKGHEMALHVLYQLYAEQASNSSEIAVSTTAAYDQFLLSLARGLRDTLPASDKSLSRLLAEAPLLPLTSLKLLEDLCNPGAVGEVATSDHITQGLSALWSLILQRPPTRDTCLKMALKCTVHESDDVRVKAIRLVANKLYPLTYVAETIEEFATQSLLAVVDFKPTDAGQRDPMEIDSIRTTQGANGDQHLGDGLTLMDMTVVEDENQQNSAKSSPVILISDAQRHMSLFFALCTKKHTLLQQLFTVYGRASKAVKQAVHRHIPKLFRTIGSSSPELLQLIADPPAGSENLLLLVLHSLTEGTEPSAELIATVKKLYETKLQVLPVFPRLVDLPPDKFQAALARILQGSAHTGPALTPAEVLIALHGIDPHRDSVPLKKVMDACSACLQQQSVFTQQVLAKVLNQLVEQTPLPLLFMRTVIQAVGAFPTLVSFVMEILSRLVNKQIWKLPKLWMGFLKCAHQTVPHSFHVLLQLPTVQLEDALKEYPTLRGPLATHANQTAVRPTVPRSSLVLLGLAQEATLVSDAGSGVAQLIAEPTSGMKAATTDLQATEQASKVSQ